MDLSTASLQLESIYQAVCASRHDNNLSCYKDYLLYSKCNCPVVQNLASKQVPSFLIGHTAEVNGQCFVPNSDSNNANTFYIISTSYDKTAIIWSVSANDKEKTIEHKLLHKFVSPDDYVFTSRCCLTTDGDQFISITTSLDCAIYLWINNELKQTIKTQYLCFDSKLHTVNKDNLVFNFLFLAGSDNKTHVFQICDSSIEFLFDLSGHSDWIKCIDILDLTSRHLEFLVASSSQDSFIRVWHTKLVDYEIDSSQVRTIVSRTLSHSSQASISKSFKLTATLETVLSGHQGIVHGLCWFKKLPEPSLQLLTCSSDKTIVIWKSSISPLINESNPENRQQLNLYDQCPATAEIWKEQQRFGETGETNLPFLGVCLSHDESTFYSHSLRGAIHSWKKGEDETWIPGQTITGHFGPITDLSWEKTGSYLLSSSLDKTCRLHAISRSDGTWHEICRPQVHGHEINCLASLDFIKFATGSEEKTIRTFEATQFSLKSLKALTMLDLPKEVNSELDKFPVHAQLPALGLSNKGAQSPYDIECSGDKNGSGTANSNWYGISKLVEQLAEVDHLNELPIEEVLLQSTLWWETNKLFGHSNELHALAADSRGSFIASASKANRKDLASILVWECTKFRKVATIEHHALTITRLRFSPNSKYLLSVSRDRTWCLSEQTGKLRSAFKKITGTTKSNAIHERIIWDCCWTCDSNYFMTVSRDKKAIVWSIDTIVLQAAPENQTDTISCVLSRSFDCSIQAVDSPDRKLDSDSYLFALGFENGSIELHTLQKCTTWQSLKSISHFHHLPIRRLAFQPTGEGAGQQNQKHLLASASDDCTLRLTQVDYISKEILQ